MNWIEIVNFITLVLLLISNWLHRKDVKGDIEMIKDGFMNQKAYLHEHRAAYQEKYYELEKKISELETRINDYELCNAKVVLPKEKND
jgi:septation ring formation regulator EzrA